MADGRSAAGKKTARPRDEQGRLLLPSGQVDDSPQDCWSVKRFRDRPGYFELKHYLDQEQGRACCSMSTTRSPRDLEVALAEGIDVDIVTLRRTPDCVNKKRLKQQETTNGHSNREDLRHAG